MTARTLRIELATRLPRAGIVALTLAGLSVGTLGFQAAPMRSGGAFPCQGSGCGCRTAAQCWWGCCCSTPGERLAWAERNGVAPPEGFVAVARADAATRAERSCCAAHAGCCGKGGCAKPQRVVSRAEKSPADGRPVLTAPRCGGLGLHWIAGGEPLGLPDRPAGLSPPVVVTAVVALAPRYAHAAPPPESPPG